MGTPALQLNLKGLQFLYPTAEADPRRVPEGDIPGIPTWIKRAVDLYELTFLDRQNAPIFLVLPKTEIAFQHLRRIYDQLNKRLNAHLLIVADHLPPKYRPLLARCRIPFIYKDEAIFAPDLGLRTSNLKTLQREPKSKIRKDGLTPFALKVLAGVLTNQIPNEFTLTFFNNQLREKGFKIALGKLSATLNELAAADLLTTQPAGKTKNYAKKSASDYLKRLDHLKFGPFFREVETNYIPANRDTYAIAGETALAHYTNLAEPTQQTIAMSAKDYRAVFARENATVPYGDFGNPSIVQVWKEDPRLFALKGVINPLELFFSMKTHTDERVQMSLDELLASYGMKRN
jgi:hypothetical protein